MGTRSLDRVMTMVNPRVLEKKGQIDYKNITLHFL